MILKGLDDFCSCVPDLDRAEEMWIQALVVLEEMGQPEAEVVRAKLDEPVVSA